MLLLKSNQWEVEFWGDYLPFMTILSSQSSDEIWWRAMSNSDGRIGLACDTSDAAENEKFLRAYEKINFDFTIET